MLLERHKLTSGSTFHAAGLVGQLRSSANITQLLGYSVDLYKRLEEETGQATGWKMNGGLRLACNAERWNEVKRQATTAKSFGLEMHLLSPAEAQDLWPLMTVDDVIGAAFLPTDGQANPTDITMALARGARQAGVTICEDTEVRRHRGRRRGDQGCGHVAGPHRVQRGGVLRRPMDAVARGDGRGQRATRVGAAPVRDHRAVHPRGAAQPADTARPGSTDLLQGRGRRTRDGRLRAEPRSVGDERDPRTASTSSSSTPTSITSHRRWSWQWVGSRRCRPPASTS